MRFYHLCAILFFPCRFLKKETMMPMGLNSTHFISYHEIKIVDVDLIEDAFGLNAQYRDVIDPIRYVRTVPEKDLTDRLIEKIRKLH